MEQGLAENPETDISAERLTILVCDIIVFLCTWIRAWAEQRQRPEPPARQASGNAASETLRHATLGPIRYQAGQNREKCANNDCLFATTTNYDDFCGYCQRLAKVCTYCCYGCYASKRCPATCYDPLIVSASSCRELNNSHLVWDQESATASIEQHPHRDPCDICQGNHWKWGRCFFTQIPK